MARALSFSDRTPDANNVDNDHDMDSSNRKISIVMTKERPVRGRSIATPPTLETVLSSVKDRMKANHVKLTFTLRGNTRAVEDQKRDETSRVLFDGKTLFRMSNSDQKLSLTHCERSSSDGY